LISGEKDLPAKEQKNEAGAWFYEENAHGQRSECDQKAQGKRAQGFECLKAGQRDVNQGQAP
jgi:uncharacterized membrane protein